MKLTRKVLDQLANKGRVKECLAFRPELPTGHHPTFVLVFSVVLSNGEIIEGPLRADNGNIREIRDPKRVLKTALRFGVPGVYMSILESTSKPHRLKHISADDWELIVSRTKEQAYGEAYAY